MRTTKFRAWDDEIHHMYYPPNSHIAMWCDGGCINLQTGKKLIPMFWTGLLDKNGREIFESDIVKYSVKSKTFIKVIEYSEILAGFWIIGDLDRLREPIHWKIEVIGNIYEHFYYPELPESDPISKEYRSTHLQGNFPGRNMGD